MTNRKSPFPRHYIANVSWCKDQLPTAQIVTQEEGPTRGLITLHESVVSSSGDKVLIVLNGSSFTVEADKFFKEAIELPSTMFNTHATN